jgi:hypothetical protein
MSASDGARSASDGVMSDFEPSEVNRHPLRLAAPEDVQNVTDLRVVSR